MLMLFLLAACAGAPQVAETPENRSAAAAALGQLEIDSGGLDKVLDDGAEAGLSYASEPLSENLGRELNSDESARVRAIIRSSLEEILTPERWLQVLTEVYAESFSAQELEEIRAFFETSAGAKVLQLDSRLAEQVEAAGDAVFEAHLDEFIALVDEKLVEEFGELAVGETP
jgi:hypothetical protein